MSGTAALLALRVVSICFQLAYIKIYTQYLGADELGRFFFLLTLSYAANALIFVPLDYYQQAKFIDFYDKPLPAKAILCLNLQAGATAAVLFAIGGSVLWAYGKLSLTELGALFLYSICLHLCTATRNLLNNLGHKIFVVLMITSEVIFRIGIFLVARYFVAPDAELLFETSIMAFLLEILIITFFLHKTVMIDWKNEFRFQLKEALGASYPLSFSAVCNWLQLQGYRVAYVNLGFASIAGIYATVANVGAVGMSAGAQIASQILSPRLYRTRGEFFLKYLTIALGLVAVALLGYALIGEIILHMLTRAELAEYWKILLFGTAIEGGNFIIGIITTYLTIKMRSRSMMIANLFGVIVAAVGFTVLYRIDLNNVYLIGIPILVSQIVVASFLFIQSRKSHQ